MKVRSSIWDELTRVVKVLLVALLFVAGIIAVYVWYRPEIEKNRRYRREILELEAKIEAEERLARQYREAIDAIQNDPRVVEKLVREKLGYARTNETVVRFEDPARR